ncbi:MAG: NYN domain-containing protein [Deltaproteobacteria bacterium]|nr:NYN domain-containing protein [Deltaproteobacteria bacterium]
MINLCAGHDRVIAFVDGQNLFHAVREAFGYTYPNYDVKKLAQAVCKKEGWRLVQTRFYTGVPNSADNKPWHHFWANKLAIMHQVKNAFVYTRPLRYTEKDIILTDGSVVKARIGEEKGIDVRIAIDIIRLAHQQVFDIALVFSQDQDLSEVAEEIRVISREQNRWIKIASSFPEAPQQRGINKTDWVPFDKLLYDVCLDLRDYRAQI